MVASRISFLKAMLKFVLRLWWTNACVLLAFKWFRKTVNVAPHCLGRPCSFLFCCFGLFNEAFLTQEKKKRKRMQKEPHCKVPFQRQEEMFASNIWMVHMRFGCLLELKNLSWS